MQNIMTIFDPLINKLDRFQRRTHLLAFSFAVIKKYGDDQAGYQAALLTYYGFLSLFPLLLVLTTVLGLVAAGHPDLQQRVLTATTDYIPVLGSQVSEHVGGLHKSGWALLVGILFTLYGARGVADAFRHGMNHLWNTPKVAEDGFPKSLLKNFSLIAIGGVGLIVTSIASGLAASAGHGYFFRLLSLIVNTLLLFGLFMILLNLSLPRHVSVRQARPGAIAAAIGLVVMQSLGSLILTRELKNLDALYSYFAIALGLLFWIYLQSQIIYYAAEIAVVHSERLWPRSLSGRDLTDADKRALTARARHDRLARQERITTEFSDD